MRCSNSRLFFFAGYIVDQTNNYNIPFYVLGTCQIIGGLLVTSIVVIDKLRGSRGDNDVIIDNTVELENAVRA